MNPVPPAPWHLTGDAAGFLAGPLQFRLLVNYHTSPVGPYHEHAIARLTWKGPSVIQMGVDNEDSLRGGRENWGYPKVLEKLTWTQRRGVVEFRRGKRVFRVRPFGPALGIALSGFTGQKLNGVPVTVPCHIRGKLRLALSGRQLGVYVDNFSLIVEPPL